MVKPATTRPQGRVHSLNAESVDDPTARFAVNPGATLKTVPSGRGQLENRVLFLSWERPTVVESTSPLSFLQGIYPLRMSQPYAGRQTWLHAEDAVRQGLACERVNLKVNLLRVPYGDEVGRVSSKGKC